MTLVPAVCSVENFGQAADKRRKGQTARLPDKARKGHRQTHHADASNDVAGPAAVPQTE
jgi:hypothetical protein